MLLDVRRMRPLSGIPRLHVCLYSLSVKLNFESVNLESIASGSRSIQSTKLFEQPNVKNVEEIAKRLTTTSSGIRLDNKLSIFVLKQIRNPDDETQCSACPQGTLPNAERSQCLSIPEVYLRPDTGWAIGAMSFSTIGILLTFAVNTTFIFKIKMHKERRMKTLIESNRF